MPLPKDEEDMDNYRRRTASLVSLPKQHFLNRIQIMGKGM
jgi:hypothetical protein